MIKGLGVSKNLIALLLLAFSFGKLGVVGASTLEGFDKKAKGLGYVGFEERDLVSMIYRTQTEGGLETYLNKVIGCFTEPDYCYRHYSKVKVFQVLDDSLLYSFSQYDESLKNYFEFLVHVEKETGKMYQEGQRLSKKNYVFTGMFKYKALNGTDKEIPSFKAVDL